MAADITTRDMADGERERVFDLVMRSFDRFLRPDYSDEGIGEFGRAAHSFVVERPVNHRISVAERDGALLGMIDVRDWSHICLFFVEPSEQGQGIGRALLAAAVEQSVRAGVSPRALTVNSSPWAVKVYERLGFARTGPLVEHKGIRAVPMTRQGTLDDRTNEQQDRKNPSSTWSMGALIGIGAGLGLVAGNLLDNLALGLAFGAGLGTVAGAIVEANRRR